MRIACLQFAPLVGDVENNINIANTILDKADPKGLDLLVLPEMAFSGEYSNMNPFFASGARSRSPLW
jgi:predicted amidohydrolase